MRKIIILLILIVFILNLNIIASADEIAKEIKKGPGTPRKAEAGVRPRGIPQTMTFGEVVSIDTKDSANPTIKIKDMRTNEINTIVVKPNTKISKTVDLKINEIKKGEFARVIYGKEEDDKNIARIIFIREAMPTRPPIIEQKAVPKKKK